MNATAEKRLRTSRLGGRIRFGVRALLVLLAAGLLGACASVKDTAAFYVALTPRTFPPKEADAPIPILEKEPREPHQVIGALRFESNRGWNFMRKSMLYNARANGADAVFLKNTTTRQQWGIMQTPARMDWVPVTNWCRDKEGHVYSNTTWVPFFRPGFTQPYVEEITGIDARMLVFKK